MSKIPNGNFSAMHKNSINFFPLRKEFTEKNFNEGEEVKLPPIRKFSCMNFAISPKQKLIVPKLKPSPLRLNTKKESSKAIENDCISCRDSESDDDSSNESVDDIQARNVKDARRKMTIIKKNSIAKVFSMEKISDSTNFSGSENEDDFVLEESEEEEVPEIRKKSCSILKILEDNYKV